MILGRTLVLMSLVAACGENPFATPEAPCAQRVAYYPDADGDDIGDADGEVYISCEDPGEGWTQTPPPASDTDLHDTDVGDTDVRDTDG